MIRLTCAILVASVAAAGCGDDETTDDPNAPVTLTFLRHDNLSYSRADTEAFTTYKATRPNVTITEVTVDYPSLGATLLTDLKGDKLSADLVRIQPSWLCSFADNLAEVPADVVTLAEAQNTFFAAPLSGSTCGGKLKGLPMEFNLEYGGVVVNMDKYQAKFPGKAPTWANWEAFIADAKALAEYDGTGKPMANGLELAPDWAQPVKHIFFSQILQRGGNYWATGGTTFDFSTAAAKASLTAMVNWVTVDKVMSPTLVPDKNTFITTRMAKGATGYGWNDPVKPLSVMGYVGSWGVPDTISQMPAGMTTKYEFHTLPPMVGAEHKFVQNSGWALAVPKTSKNQKAAWALIKAITLSPEIMRKWDATTGSLPALRVNGTAQAAASNPTLLKVQPLLDKGQWVGYIPALAIETVEGALVSNLFEAVAGRKTIDQALADMQTTANAALAQHR
jgi:multiple sugar transport system substrate-binding protein